MQITRFRRLAGTALGALFMVWLAAPAEAHVKWFNKDYCVGCGAEVQLRMVAAGRGLGLVPRAVFGASVLRDEIAVVDVTDFSLSLDIWLVHRRQTGNLHKALETVVSTMSSRLERPGQTELP
jgi:DNA-binding transcriptional LysR family regulator